MFPNETGSYRAAYSNLESTEFKRLNLNVSAENIDNVQKCSTIGGSRVHRKEMGF